MELLRTERLLLRQWTEADADAFLAIYGRDDVSRWLGTHPRKVVANLSEAKERLSRWQARVADLPAPLGLWALVEFALSDRPVGTLVLLPLHDSHGPTDEVEIGWHLHPDRQGRGLATEAARAVLARAALTGIDHVLALTDLDNAASQRVAERLGMIDEGTTDRWLELTARQYRKDLR